MRRFLVLVRATAQEIASEPLAFLLTMSALVLAVVTPALHYHQFGEPSRMARDAGLSALLVGGLAYAVFCTVKTFRREIESGTMQMALAHSVSRATFFMAKLVGVLVAHLLFALTVTAASLTVINGAEIGGRLATEHGGVSPIWGPSFAYAVAAIIVPPVVAAILNRFANCRWTLTATRLTFLVAALGVFYRFDGSLVARVVPVALVLLLPVAVIASAAAACAVRWRENAALSATGVLLALSLPALGNYYLSDVLAKGGSLAWSHVGLALIATAPLVAAFALVGIALLDGRDVGGEG